MNDQSFTAYILALVVTGLFLLLAVIIATSIKYQSGAHPRDKQKRRTWFWVLAVLTPIVIFATGYAFIYLDIKIPTLRDKFLSALSIATGAGFVVYIAICWVLSALNKKGKLGHWFN